MNNTKLVESINARARNRWLIVEFLPVLLAIVAIVIVAFVEYAIRNG